MLTLLALLALLPRAGTTTTLAMAITNNSNIAATGRAPDVAESDPSIREMLKASARSLGFRALPGSPLCLRRVKMQIFFLPVVYRARGIPSAHARALYNIL